MKGRLAERINPAVENFELNSNRVEGRVSRSVSLEFVASEKSFQQAYTDCSIKIGL